MLNLPKQAWFDVQLMHKDIRLVLETGRELGVPVPSAAAADALVCGNDWRSHEAPVQAAPRLLGVGKVPPSRCWIAAFTAVGPLLSEPHACPPPPVCPAQPAR
jgi:hypothetical protein